MFIWVWVDWMTSLPASDASNGGREIRRNRAGKIKLAAGISTNDY